jgi:hypothetical protein
MCSNAKCRCQENRARKKAREPKDYHHWRTSQRGSEDKSPPSVDVAITKDVRKKSHQIIILDNVWFLIDYCKTNAYGILAWTE